MRTTITLDADVADLLRRTVQERNVSFKEAVNEAIRTGLKEVAHAHRQPFRQKTVSLGAEQHFRWEKALSTAAALEDEDLVRKMALRK
ncbi:antitoxin [Paracidobacterium acidisoli]|uniref:Antitoxin n=1 Tax=Paracidobacterium acidisoli TaxID=2303751 RepID=A0A372IKU5_9BACT|nr:antitoxin [Paracidobacterium acidisoli]MBT9332901.1 hypothetical protein [Paracidobacterium acidisoli]